MLPLNSGPNLAMGLWIAGEQVCLGELAVGGNFVSCIKL